MTIEDMERRISDLQKEASAASDVYKRQLHISSIVIHLFIGLLLILGEVSFSLLLLCFYFLLQYGSVDDEDQWEDYGAFVEDMRDRAVNAFAQVRSTLGHAAERSKQYYYTTSTLSEVGLKKANGFGTST